MSPPASSAPNLTLPDQPAAPLRLTVLMPLYDDWEAAEQVLRRLDELLDPACGVSASVLLVDDFSPNPAPPGFLSGPFRHLEEAHLLRLRRNLGHQRALCVGLAYLETCADCDAVVIMDADGEDRPEDVPRLLERFRAEGGEKIVFAERTRRSEGLFFRFMYWLYRCLHRVLSGVPVRFGNFSLIPASLLPALSTMSETWSHYTAAVLKGRLPYTSLPTVRGTRLAGKSHMNLTGLTVHGITALAVFAEVIGVRVVFAALGFLLLTLLVLAAIAFIRFGTNLAVPGWATTTSLLMLNLCLDVLIFAGLACLLVLSARTAAGFVPARDYDLFVAGVTRVYPAPVESGA